MKAVQFNTFGGPEVLEIGQNIARPAVGPGQVLLQVRAAGVNPLDWKIRKGELKLFLGSKLPMTPGNDASGILVELGPGVKGFQPGDEVFCFMDAAPRASCRGFARPGSYAEYAVTRADTLALKPRTLSHAEAASIPLAALTAYQALHYRAGVTAGQRVLINGASGGVGIFAVQIAKRLGAQVSATCSQDNQALVLALGADKCIDYRRQPLTTLNESFDVIYDVAASHRFAQCRHLLTKSGIFLSNIATPASLLANALYPLQQSLRKPFGPFQRQTHAWVKPSGSDLQVIARWVDEGRLRTLLDRSYPLEACAEAHRYSESGRVRGKLVIDLNLT